MTKTMLHEMRIHEPSLSRYLAYLLNPFGSHEYGELILEKVLSVIQGKLSKDRKLPCSGLKKVYVQAEHNLGPDRGRVDISISANEFVVFIEVKLRSGPSKDQLEKYKEKLGQICEGGIKNTCLIFLAPSATYFEGIPDNVIKMSFGELAACIKEAAVKNAIIKKREKEIIKFLESHSGSESDNRNTPAISAKLSKMVEDRIEKSVSDKGFLFKENNDGYLLFRLQKKGFDNPPFITIQNAFTHEAEIGWNRYDCESGMDWDKYLCDKETGSPKSLHLWNYQQLTPEWFCVRRIDNIFSYIAIDDDEDIDKHQKKLESIADFIAAEVEILMDVWDKPKLP